MEGAPQDDEKIDRLRRAMYSRSLSPKLHERPRRELDRDDAPVGEDWQHEEKRDGAIVPSRFDFLHGVGIRWFVVGLVAFGVGILAFFAYYFTLGGGAGTTLKSNVTISISGPQTLTGGSLSEVLISVANQNSADIQLADLILTYPPGTRLSANLPTDTPSQRISVGTVRPGEVRKIPVRAVFSGSEGDTTTLKAELEYRMNGSSAIFTADSSYEISFSSSPLSISVEGNEETVSGQAVALTMIVSSNATQPIKDALLKVEYPFGFTFTSADPMPVQNGFWELGDIIPGRAVRIDVHGVLCGESGDERVFRMTAGTRKTPDSQSVDTVLATNIRRVAISQAFLGLTINVNNESGTGAVVSPGEDVNVSIAWKNNLQKPITDAVIVARLSGIVIDGATVRSNDGFYRSSDNAMLWDKTTTKGEFTNLAPGSNGSVTFTFKMPASEDLAGLQNPRMVITVNGAGKRLSESGVPENLQATAVQNIKLASDLQVVAQGLYHANPFGASGPLPPKAGEETSYVVLFTITNTINNIENAKLTATLPAYVRSLGQFLPETADITFDNINGTVTWNMGDIPSGVGVNGTRPVQSAIALGVTPSTSQIGSVPVILQNIKLVGVDVVNGTTVTRSADNVTTSLLDDPGFTSTDATVVR